MWWKFLIFLIGSNLCLFEESLSYPSFCGNSIPSFFSPLTVYFLTLLSGKERSRIMEGMNIVAEGSVFVQGGRCSFEFTFWSFSILNEKKK